MHNMPCRTSFRRGWQTRSGCNGMHLLKHFWAPIIQLWPDQGFLFRSCLFFFCHRVLVNLLLVSPLHVLFLWKTVGESATSWMARVEPPGATASPAHNLPQLILPWVKFHTKMCKRVNSCRAALPAVGAEATGARLLHWRLISGVRSW